MNLDGLFVEFVDETTPLSSLHGATSLEAQGSYNTLDFVVRLRPDLQSLRPKVASFPCASATLGMLPKLFRPTFMKRSIGGST